MPTIPEKLPKQERVEREFEEERGLAPSPEEELAERRAQIDEILAEPDSGLSLEDHLAIELLDALSPAGRDRLIEAGFIRWRKESQEKARKTMSYEDLTVLKEELEDIRLPKDPERREQQLHGINHLLIRLKTDMDAARKTAHQENVSEDIQKAPQFMVDMLANLDGNIKARAKALADKNWDRVGTLNAQVLIVLNKIRERFDLIARQQPAYLLQLVEAVRQLNGERAEALQEVLLAYFETHPLTLPDGMVVQLRSIELLRRHGGRGRKPTALDALYDAWSKKDKGGVEAFLNRMGTTLGGIPEKRIEQALGTAFPKGMPISKAQPPARPERTKEPKKRSPQRRAA